MISTLLLDLGDTLESNGKPLPGALEALETLAKGAPPVGHPLRLALVSDYMEAKPPTPENVEGLFREYVALVETMGLLDFFRPVEERITLSTHAGKRKPHAEIFELALHRLGPPEMRFQDCLFITENADHVAACRRLGMKALELGKDFSNWEKAPAVIAGFVG
jgi:FMN phosphatase YigB (HAD superfamily)